MKLWAQRRSVLRHAIGLAPLIALVAPVGRAEAACDPISPVNNATVTCTGTTNNQNGTTGYGTATDTGNTINVVSGAAVVGFGVGLEFNTGTVNNSGLVTGGGGSSTGAGISADSVNVIGNTGTISGGLEGIRAITLVTVTSSGTISGGRFGIIAGTAKVDNAGFITATDTTGFGIFAPTLADVINRVTGKISGEQFGIFASLGVANVDNAGVITATRTGIFAAALNVKNTGTISATGASSLGISGLTVTVSNSGTISAGPSGFAIDAVDAVTVNNAASGTISGGLKGINTVTATVDNAGTISATGTNGIGIDARDADVVNRAGGRISGGIQVANNAKLINAGTIVGSSFTVLARTVDLTNSGAISATGLHGHGVNAATATVNNSGSISGGADGAGIVAITANVTNSGTISAGNTAIGVGIANVTNSGTISGKIGIAADHPDKSSTIDNSGTIIGTGGTAIKLTSAADTLTLRNGSRIVGVVDMGFGNDLVDVVVSAPNTRVSSLTTVALPTFINFSGVLNTSFCRGQ